MTIKSRKWSAGFTVSLLVALLLGCTGIRQDELECEDAVSHLQQCCPGFTGSNVDCTYEPGGCEVPPVNPEITSAESACIRAQSCDELRASGVCARAIALPATQDWANSQSTVGLINTTGASSQPPQVCP